MNTIYVIGCGGVTCQFADALLRFLSYDHSQDDVHVTFIDGDKIEQKNLTRQFDNDSIGGNKAKSLVRSYSQRYPTVSMSGFSEYITPENISQIIGDDCIILLAVDNHKTRKVVNDYVIRALKNCFLISGGNDLTTGTVQILHIEEGELQTPSLDAHHPEIRTPRDKSPHEIGCDQKVESQPQVLFMNFEIAAGMLNAFYKFWKDGFVEYFEVSTDIESNSRVTTIQT